MIYRLESYIIFLWSQCIYFDVTRSIKWSLRTIYVENKFLTSLENRTCMGKGLDLSSVKKVCDKLRY